LECNLDVSKQQIESRINQIRTDLPAGIQITVEKMNPSILPVTGYALESTNRSPIELKKKIANDKAFSFTSRWSARLE
jgi:multidrug efflux pump subunit AcrB